MAKILVVDNDRPSRQFLTNVLSYKSHRIIEASDGAEGLKLAKSERPDLVISDILMPSMDGYQFVHALRNDPEISHTAVVFYSATYHEKEAKALAEKCGIVRTIYRPCEPQVVLDTVAAALRKDLPSRLPADLGDKHLEVVAMKLTEKIRTLEAANIRLNALMDLGRRITEERNPILLMENFCIDARKIIGSRYAAIGLLNEQRSSLAHYFFYGTDAEASKELKPGSLESLLHSAFLKEGRPFRTANVTFEESARIFPPTHPVVNNLLTAPIATKNRFYGFLYLVDKVGLDEFTEEDERVAQTLAAQVSITYANGNLYAALQNHAKKMEQEISERKQAQESLLILSRAVEQGADNVVITDHNGIIQYVNPAFEKLSGYSSEEAIGKTPRIIKSGKYDQPFYDGLWQSILSGKTFRFQFVNKRKNDELYYSEETITPIKDENGNITHFVSTGKDITKNKLAEESLAKSEERYRKLFEQNPLPMWVYDDQTLSFLDVNDAAIRHYGYSKNEFLGMTLKDVRPHEEVARMAKYRETTSPGGVRLTEAGVWKHRKKDGTLIDIEAVWSKIDFYGKSAKLALINDVTQRIIAEEALRASEERFRQIAENISEVFWISNLQNTKMLYVSPAYEEIWGRTRQSLYEQPLSFMEAIHPEDREPVIQEIERQMREGKFDQEYRIIRPDGSLRWIWARSFPVPDQSGEVTRIAGIAQDITERKRAEEAIRQSEERFRLTFEESPLGMVLVDLNYKFVNMNRSFCEMIGYSEKELRTMTFRELTHTEDVKSDVDLAVRLFRGEIPSYRIQKRYVKKNGELIWVELTGTLIRDSEGGPRYGFGMIENIHEKKQAEERLAAEHAVTRLLAEAHTLRESTPKILEVLCKTLNWEFGAIRTVDRKNSVLKFVDLWHGPEFHEPEFDEVSRTMEFASGFELPGTVWAKRASHWIEDFPAITDYPRARAAQKAQLHGALAFPIFSGEEIVGVIEFFSKSIRRPDAALMEMLTGLGTQIGEFMKRRQSEESKSELEKQLLQAQKIEAIGQLAGGVAHDFNNTLMAISSYAELLLMQLPEQHSLKRIATEIQKSTEQGSNLTKQLLAFSRKQVLAPKVLNLNLSIEKMQNMLGRLIGEDIELIMSLSRELGYVKADPGQIEQVLMNLSVNARDAMRQGGKLTIETSNTEIDDNYALTHIEVVPGKYVLLAISDTGSGMSEEILSRIFEPFFTTKEEGKGTGLGLSTVFGIVKQSGGHISVYSQPGRGTTFKIFLPRLDQNQKHIEIPNVFTGKTDGQGEVVLLVDDSDSIRFAMSNLLELKGYRVLTAAGGREALKTAEESGAIDLLISDVVMPGMSGRQLSRELTALRPGLKTLFLSGYTEDAIARHGILEPGAAFLSKPATMQSLLSKIRDLLE